MDQISQAFFAAPLTMSTRFCVGPNLATCRLSSRPSSTSLSEKEATQCAACDAHHKAERALPSSIYLLLSFGRNSYPAISLRPRAFLHVWLVGREGRRR